MLSCAPPSIQTPYMSVPMSVIPVALVPRKLPVTVLFAAEAPSIFTCDSLPAMTLRVLAIVPPRVFPAAFRMWTPACVLPGALFPEGSTPRTQDWTTLLSPVI